MLRCICKKSEQLICRFGAIGVRLIALTSDWQRVIDDTMAVTFSSACARSNVPCNIFESGQKRMLRAERNVAKIV